MLQIIMIIVMIIITLWIFFGNFLVLLAFLRIRQIRSIDNMIIGSLSVTDFLLSISVAPLAIYNLYAPSEYRIFASCLLWLSSDVFLSTVSIWHLCAISFERFYCVVFPLKFMYRRKKRVKILIILSWLSGFVITIPLVIMALVDKSTVFRTESQNLTDNSAGLLASNNLTNFKKLDSFGNLNNDMTAAALVAAITAPTSTNRHNRHFNVNKTFKLDFQIGFNSHPSNVTKKIIRSLVDQQSNLVVKSDNNNYFKSITVLNNQCSYFNAYYSILSVIFSYWFPLIVMLFLTIVTMIVLNRSKYRIDPRVKIKYMLKNKRRSTRLLVNAVAATAAVAHVKPKIVEMETESIILPSYVTSDMATCSTQMPKVSFRIHHNSNLVNTANQLLKTDYNDKRKGYFDFEFNEKIEETDFIDECFENVDIEDDEVDDDDDEIDEDVIDDTTTAVAIAAATAIQMQDEFTTTAISSSACQAESTIILDLDTIATTTSTTVNKDDDGSFYSRRSSAKMRNKLNHFKNSLKLGTKITNILRKNSCRTENECVSNSISMGGTASTSNVGNNGTDGGCTSTEHTLLSTSDNKSYSSSRTDSSLKAASIKLAKKKVASVNRKSSKKPLKTSQRSYRTLNTKKSTTTKAKPQARSNLFIIILERLRKLICFTCIPDRLTSKLFNKNNRNKSQKCSANEAYNNFNNNNNFNTININPANLNNAANKAKNPAASRLMQYICKESEAQRRSLIVLIAFIVGYTPLFTLITISWCTNLQLNSNYFVTLTWLGYLSSALNVFFYAWMNRNLKRAFYLIITCKLNRKQSKPRTSQLLVSLNNTNSKAF